MAESRILVKGWIKFEIEIVGESLKKVGQKIENVVKTWEQVGKNLKNCKKNLKLAKIGFLGFWGG